MRVYSIRPFEKDIIPDLVGLSNAYAKVVKVPELDTEYFLDPAFDDGTYILCLFTENGTLCAFATIYPRLVEIQCSIENRHTLWVDFRFDPDLDGIDQMLQVLLVAIRNKAEAISEYLFGRTRLAVGCFSWEHTKHAFLNVNRFRPFDSLYKMVRQMKKPVPKYHLSPDLQFQPMLLLSVAEQRRYLEAENEAFPDSPTTIERLMHIIQSSNELRGLVVTPSDNSQKIIGSVLVYVGKEPNNSLGYTEDIFVQSEWRGKGLGRYLISEALLHLRKRNVETVMLEVLKSNKAAIKLYERLGYEKTTEEILFELGL